MLNILVACEEFGEVRDALRARGFNAVSCDIKPSAKPGPHIQGYLEDTIGHGSEWDFIIGFPPCTYLCSSGLHWNKRVQGRADKTEYALCFVAMMANKMRLARYGGVFENPVGCISTRIALRDDGYEVLPLSSSGFVPSNLFKPYQTIQPYMFGADASKATNLWRVEGVVKWNRRDTIVEGIPMLRPTNRIAGRMVKQKNGKYVERWGNQTDSGQNRLGPSDDRATLRGKTYPGIAAAMAEQWGDWLISQLKK
jgi:hypothetical protein